ncbi:MAG: hypothetical protein PHR28_10160 [candidate division Zixibacteria bacterium]|nr:hypothetical protein [candidate division Zixibacteria bacterium]
MKTRIVMTAIMAVLLLGSAGSAGAANYVNWKAGFWFAIPEGWDKIDYRVVDRFLSLTDTSREIYGYEAVYAPLSSALFMEDAYLVVTFDSIGALSPASADSVLNTIAKSYGKEVFNAPIVSHMTDLVPGQPVIDRAAKAVSVVTEMAFRPEAKRKLWLYMCLNDAGLISLYFYSPDSTFTRNKPTFEKIIQSLSFDNLRQAAGNEQVTFTDVGGDNVEQPKAEYSDSLGDVAATTSSGGGTGRIVMYVVIIVIVLGLALLFILGPRLKKRNTTAPKN